MGKKHLFNVKNASQEHYFAQNVMIRKLPLAQPLHYREGLTGTHFSYLQPTITIDSEPGRFKSICT